MLSLKEYSASRQPLSSYLLSGKHEVLGLPHLGTAREQGLQWDLWNFPAPLNQQVNKKGAHGIPWNKGHHSVAPTGHTSSGQKPAT